MKKLVLVIGSTSGYGKAIAMHLHNTGYQVVGAARSVDREQMPFPQVALDVKNSTSIEECIKIITKSDEKLFAVIYSAGIAKGLNCVIDGNELWWKDVFETNTIGLLRVAKIAIPRIEVGGIFLHIGSISSKLNYVGGADYCASKAASSSIMKNLRLELAGKNIRSTSLEPGYAKTNFMLNRFDGDVEKADKKIKPLDVEDVAKMVGFILGQNPNINIDEIFIKPIEQITH